MSAGLGFGSTNRQPAQPRHDAGRPIPCYCGIPDEAENMGGHRYGTGPECSKDAAPRASAAPHSPQSAGVAAGDGSDGPEASQGTTAAGSVPEELIELANETLWRLDPNGSREELAEFLEAVLPAHEAMVRQRVAEEIDAAPIHKILAEDENDKDVHAAWCPGCRAARIARGDLTTSGTGPITLNLGPTPPKQEPRRRRGGQA